MSPRIGSVISDLARVNIAFLRDAASRNRVRRALHVDRGERQLAGIVDADCRTAPAHALPYANLTSYSLALAGITTSGRAGPTLNVVVGQVTPEAVFVGMHTALTAASRLAQLLERRLRIVTLDPLPAGFSARDAEASVERLTPGVPVEVVPRERIRSHSYSTDDIWLATHFKTAHALHVACECRVLDPANVAYLIQDFEPGFTPWSTEYVLAEATYRAGFLPIVNSLPLASFLRDRGYEAPAELVFAPAFPHEKLEEAALARIPSDSTSVAFYARPSKHRNLHALGVSALRYAAERLDRDGSPTTFRTIGQRHRNIALPGGGAIESLGRLSWDGYFAFLSSVDVLLSLQQSPHPSHPPFDAAISGGLAVTNDFENGRARLHPRIAAVPADTRSLGEAVLTAVRVAREHGPAGYLPVETGTLGSDLDDVLKTAAARLSGEGAPLLPHRGDD